jgi:bifunctional ADP-heptose synthase (sugar kinase/adenylyltransferase)
LLEIGSLELYAPAEWQEYVGSFCQSDALKLHAPEQPGRAGQLLARIQHRRGADAVAPDYALSAKLVDPEALGCLRRRERMTLGVVSGSFDLLHLGHVRGLVYAKRCLARYPNPRLCAMALSDEHIRAKKGPSRPILNLNERLDMLCHLACTDYVIPLKEPDCLAALDQLRPDYFFKNDGDRSQPAVGQEMEFVKAYGGTVILFPPESVRGRSTTEIIETILGRQSEAKTHAP